jgi:hypothetical protein
LAIAAALAGCSSGDGFGTILAEPGRYVGYHCRDMVARLTYLHIRKKELSDLMAKANSGAAGAVIGTLSYGAEYETLQTETKMLQRAAVEKKCPLETRYQSDETIR